MSEKFKYTAADFKSAGEVKWCPGCGDHAILSSVQRVLPDIAEELGYNHEDFTFVSGIGCSSRFPYYMNTYGFHCIHGRAAAIATGVKVANPKLSVWQISGDGDALAIGGNHFIHAIRRNVDLNMLLFNNEIYGLTKGQYSPTSKLGKVTKTSPYGTVEQPFTPGELVLGARGTFFARSIDVDINLTKECMMAVARHKGASVLEIMQNCVIYNNKTHEAFTNSEHRADRIIILKHGEPMLFGKEKNKGLALDGLKLKIVTVGEDGYELKDILVHDAKETNPAIHMMLVNMKYPEFPVAMGVVRDIDEPAYDYSVNAQIEEVAKDAKIKCVDDLLQSGETWTVE